MNRALQSPSDLGEPRELGRRFGAALLLSTFGLFVACGSGEEPGREASRAALLDPETCATCHAEQYREWSGSMHAYAADDPVFLAMNQRGQRETGGELGAFCVNCHAPLAVREGATTDGLNLEEVPRALKGVTCFFCHSVSAVEGTHNNPLKLAEDRVLRGGYRDPVENSVHRSAYSPLQDRDQSASAELCGACHDIVVAEQAHIERTFLEWKDSLFSEPGGATCGQCHMEQSREPRPIALGGPLRRTHGHAMPGIDRALSPFPEAEAQAAAIQSQLDRTLQSALCVVDVGGTSTLRVVVDNLGAGHGFPSGSAQDRRVWFEVIAYQGDDVLYQSGVVPEGEPAVDVDDPDLWLLRDCLFDGAGHEVHMFWEARSFRSNQLPAQATLDPSDPRYFRNHVVQSYPRATRFLDGVPDRVTLRVLVEPIGLDVLDDLIASGDLERSVRAKMPRTALDLGAGEILEWTPDAETGTYIDPSGFRASCVTKSNLNLAADKIPAAASSRCEATP